MFRFVLLVTLLLGCARLTAQSDYLYLLHEGTLSTGGSLGRLDLSAPTGNRYERLADLPAFGNALIRHGDSLFIAGGNDQVYVYSLVAKALVDSIANVEPRQLAVWNGQLLVTTTDAPYFRAYTLGTLALTFSLDTTRVTNISEGLVVRGDTAFVAVNGFGVVGLGDVVAIDLVARDTLRTIRVADNPNNILRVSGSTPADDRLFVACYNPDNFSYELTVSEIDPNTLTLTRSLPTGIVSYGGFATDGQQITFNNSDDFLNPRIASLDIATGAVTDSLLGLTDSYSIYYSTQTTQWFVSRTDYFSYGTISSWNGTSAAPVLIDTTEVSPRVMLWVTGVTDPAPPCFVGQTFSFALPDSICDTASALTLVAQPAGGLFSGTGVSGARFDPAGLAAGTYTLSYRIQDGNCDTTLTASIRVVTCTPDSRSGALAQHLRLWPNPASDELQLDWTGNGLVHNIRMVDLVGRSFDLGSLEVGQSAPYQLDIRHIPAGMYTLWLETEMGTLTQRVLIRH